MCLGSVYRRYHTETPDTLHTIFIRFVHIRWVCVCIIS